MSEYTPGPWIAKQSKTLIKGVDSEFQWYVETDRGEPIWEDGTPSVCSKADACLIAAAPELLALLKKIDKFGSGLLGGEIEQSIAKAEEV